MTAFPKYSLILLSLSLFLVFANHQGAAQKVLQVFFWIMVVNIFLYIYNLRR